MTDEQISMTGRGYLSESDRQANLDNNEEMNALDEMLNILGSDLARLGQRNPERMRSLVTRLAGSQGEAMKHDRELAAIWAPQIAAVDYELARDVILSLLPSDAFDAAVDAINALPDHVTPEQAVVFDAIFRHP